jgi:hypothetical protein
MNSNTMTVVSACGHGVEVSNARAFKKARIAKHEGRPCHSCRMKAVESVGSCGHAYTRIESDRVHKGGLCPWCRSRKKYLKWMQLVRKSLKEVNDG